MERRDQAPLSPPGLGEFATGRSADLYKSHDQQGDDRFVSEDIAAGPTGAALPLGHLHEAGGPRIVSRVNSVSEGFEEWRERISARLSELDLAPDLASDIGSLRWFRGLGTMFALAAVSLLFWPSFSPVEAAAPMHIDAEIRDEFRSQMIMPLALGADSGRRMAATETVVPLRSAPERPYIELVATLAEGDSFSAMLKRAGVGSPEADEVERLVSTSMSLEEVEPGTKVDIVLGRRPSPEQTRPLDSLSFRARLDLEIVAERVGSRIVLQQRAIRIDATPLRIRGRVGTSLYRSARAAGAPASVVQQYLRALAEQVDLDRAIASSDEFDLIVSYKRAATGEVEVGDLLYAGIIRDGAPRTQLMRWGRDGQFYEASGVGEQRTGLLAPVPGRITSNYGMRRHPILGYRRMHKGMDFRAPHGTPIYAVTDGTVQTAGRNGGHGNYIKLNHGNGLATGYSHMSRLAVSSGQRVRRGQVIGYSGSTGLSTGPHLHYEMFRNGRNIDPASVQFVNRAQLSGRELESFRTQLARLLLVEPGEALESLVPTAEEMGTPQREIDRADRPREVG